MGPALAFDSFAYLKTLTWLGKPLFVKPVSALSRSFGASHHDLRGSWPYQSLPSPDQITALQQAGPVRPLSYSVVVRPDLDEDKAQSALHAIGDRFPMACNVIKVHLAHLPNQVPARFGYSSRTLERIALAETVFVSCREDIGDAHAVLGEWQNQLARLRGIPSISSPDVTHFNGLIRAGRLGDLDIAPVTLRWRRDKTIAGVFLLLAGEDGTWHGHSFLVPPEALKDYGAFLLFDRAIRILGDRPIWFGGAPAGPNGQGVFRFKQRFSNASSPARIVSVDLDPPTLYRLRAKNGTHNWLPNYRNPAAELSATEPNRPSLAMPPDTGTRERDTNLQEMPN